jgi:hypothetical protein
MNHSRSHHQDGIMYVREDHEHIRQLLVKFR